MTRKIRAILMFFVIYIISGFSVYASEDAGKMLPVIESVSVENEKIEAPGEAEIVIDLLDNRRLDAVNMVFRMKENSEKVLYYWLAEENLTVSETEDTFTCNINLAENVPAGTYQLVEIELIDTEGATAKYVSNEIGLKNWSNGREIQGLNMVVVSGCQDTDFTVPELKAISVEQEAEAGEKLHAYIKVTEDSGIQSADLVYYLASAETYLHLYPIKMVYDAKTEVYTFTYQIPKYQETGSYDFDSVCLTDDSAHKNSVTYWREKSNLRDVENRIISADNCRSLIIYFENSRNAASILKKNLYQVVRNARYKDTVIYRGGDSDGSLWILDRNSLQIAKSSQLTLVMPDFFTDSEIVIDGSRLPGDFPAEVYTGFILKELQKNIYDMKLQMTHPELPFTVKIKMPGLDKVKENAFQLYKVKKDGTMTAERNLLAINKEGYIVIEFPDGIKSSAEWNHFQLKKSEQKICSGEHKWGSAVSIVKATPDKAGRTKKVCKNCGETKMQTVAKIKTVELSATKYIYNGSSKTPTVAVKSANNNKLIKGTDYDVKYPATRKSVGRYCVTVNFKGKYSGTVKKYYTIVPKAVSSLSAIRYQYGNQIRISWSKSTGATGYRIYRKKSTSSKYTYIKSIEKTYYACGDLAQNASYRFKVIPYYKSGSSQYYSTNAYKTVLKYTSKKGSKLSRVTSVKTAKKGTGVKITWKNVSYESGYQISRSTSKNGTNIVKTLETTKGTQGIVSATKGKTYYYKVRAYRTVNNRNIYGQWSEPVKYKR